MHVLSLGGGVQSTTLALMAAEGELRTPDCAIFANTGWEPKEVALHLQRLIGCDLTWDAEHQTPSIVSGTYQGGALPYPTHVVSGGNLRDDTLRAVADGTRVATLPAFIRNADGSLALLRRQCTDGYKIKLINAKIRELTGAKPGRPMKATVEVWQGISLDEVHRMKPSQDAWRINRYPLVEDLNPAMDRYSCELWLKRHGWVSPKSACIGCPYHSNQYWRHLKDTSPEEWQDAVEFDSAIRHGLPGVKGEAYLHRSLVPLDQVDLRTQREKGQLGFFDDDFGSECEGVCGV